MNEIEDKQALNAATYTVVKVLRKIAVELSDDEAEQLAFFRLGILNAIMSIIDRAKIETDDWTIDEIERIDNDDDDKPGPEDEAVCQRCGETVNFDDIGEHDIEHGEVDDPPDENQ